MHKQAPRDIVVTRADHVAFEWQAVPAGFDAEIHPIGYGMTEEEAVADLKWQMEDGE